MIIPQPQDLPPRASGEARTLTTTVQNLNTRAQHISDQSSVKLKYTNATLQSLAQQVTQMQVFVDGLTGADDLTYVETTNFVVDTTYTTMATLVVNVPTGYTRSSLMIIGTGILNDPTAPYPDKAHVRIGINGTYNQPMLANTALSWPTGSTDVFYMASTNTILGTDPITVTMQAIADQTIQASTSTFCRLTAFTLFSQ